MSEQVDTVIDELESDWDFGEPATRELQARAANVGGVPLPPELVAFYERADGASIGPVDVFTLDELLDANKRRPKALAGATFFASDGADGFFFVDGGNALKRGATSIFWFERGTNALKGAIHCAAELTGFLRRVAAGEQPWIGASSAEVDVDTMIAKLEGSRDRWTGSPSATLKEVYEAGQRVHVYIAKELQKLLVFANGLEIPGVGVTVRDAGGIEPVAGTTDEAGHPNALWFAADARGDGYAVMTVGWRGSEGGDVVRITPGQAPEDAAILGSLPAVVIAWLDGRQP